MKTIIRILIVNPKTKIITGKEDFETYYEARCFCEENFTSDNEYQIEEVYENDNQK